MKKKLLLILTAIAIVFTSLFSFTACNKGKVKITKNMKPEKVYETLAKADVKSYSIEIISEGTSQTFRFTRDGMSQSMTLNGEEQSVTVLSDGNRVYTITSAGENSGVEIVDMMGAKFVPEYVERSNEMWYYYVLQSLLNYIYNDNNGYENEFTVSTEKGKVIISGKTDDVKIVVSKINETDLIIPSEYKDYASRETTEYIANFDEHTDGSLTFTGVKDSVIEFAIPSSFNGSAVTAIMSNYGGKFKKLTIPVSVKCIEGLDLLTEDDENIYYAGTKAQWEDIEIITRYIRGEAIIVHCVDGDVEVMEY